MDLTRTFLFHFTHINNLDGIISNGILCDSSLPVDSYVCSGSPEIKERRKNKTVPYGGVIADYIPFYFAFRSPMLYRQQMQNQVQVENIVYIVTTVQHILDGNYIWCFTNMNAAITVADFYNDITLLESEINWNYMSSRMWNNTDNHPDRKERRMAEFLVKHMVSWDSILALAACNESKANEIVAKCFDFPDKHVLCKPSWYF